MATAAFKAHEHAKGDRGPLRVLLLAIHADLEGESDDRMNNEQFLKASTFDKLTLFPSILRSSFSMARSSLRDILAFPGVKLGGNLLATICNTSR
jgi:hypothetical protein